MLEGLERAGIDADDVFKERVSELVEIMEEDRVQQALRSTVEADDPRLSGEWDLAYTSSSSFGFNEVCAEVPGERPPLPAAAFQAHHPVGQCGPARHV